MQARQLPLDVSASSLFPPAVSSLLRPLEPALNRWFFPDRLLRCVPDMREGEFSATEFSRQLLHNLDIGYHVPPQDVARIPARGPALLVANHPFGFLEGLILLSLLEDVRADYRIVANGLLSSVPALTGRLIFVNPFSERACPHENGLRLRSSLEWLRAGGLLVMFPAGEVAHLNWGERPVADPVWNSTAARLARKVNCPALPVFFEGANSRQFQMLGAIHPSLRTLNLPNELVKKRNQTVSIRVGSVISAAVLKSYADPEAATEYLRARTYLLGSRPVTAGNEVFSVWASKPKAVAKPPSADLIAREISSLPPDRVLARNDDFTVYVAEAAEIPLTLREIGRCRELTYREIGEGTGRALDLDEFDAYYRHILLWHPGDARVAGAYRMVATPDVLATRGIGGLYSSTLFHYQPEFFERIGPAFELGRSFVCREYQKQYAPLLLLWKGISACVAARPECAVLFGAVSVSSEYQALSRTLIVNFLDGHVASSLSSWIRPRRGLRKALVPKHVKRLGRLLPTVEELSSSIQDLEADGKGLPVLIRQYLKAGGQLLGFNVDPHFSNALDVLVMADLRAASGPMLERCMGQEAASSFRAWHASKNS